MSASARRRALAGSTLGVALLGLPAAADNLLKVKVFGLGLGDSLSRVQELYPDLIAENSDYEDPEVGFRYEGPLGHRVADTIETRGPVTGPEGERAEVDLRFTGDGRLYGLQGWQTRSGGVDCGAEMRKLRLRYDKPDVQVGNDRAQWIQRRGDVDRMLEVQCFQGGRMLWQLNDAQALEAYRAGLRAQLAPYVEQAKTP